MKLRKWILHRNDVEALGICIEINCFLGSFRTMMVVFWNNRNEGHLHRTKAKTAKLKDAKVNWFEGGGFLEQNLKLWICHWNKEIKVNWADMLLLGLTANELIDSVCLNTYLWAAFNWDVLIKIEIVIVHNIFWTQYFWMYTFYSFGMIIQVKVNQWLKLNIFLLGASWFIPLINWSVELFYRSNSFSCPI